MKLTKKTLLYDISNLAYTIADTGEDTRHVLHKVRDICEDGNIDRVSRVLGLAYSNLLALLMPVLKSPHPDVDRDFSIKPHDYEFIFRNDRHLNYILNSNLKLKIKETAREYMVSMVLADWLEINLPEAADIWKFKAENAFLSLQEIVSEISFTSAASTCRRRLSPF